MHVCAFAPLDNRQLPTSARRAGLDLPKVGAVRVEVATGVALVEGQDRVCLVVVQNRFAARQVGTHGVDGGTDVLPRRAAPACTTRTRNLRVLPAWSAGVPAGMVGTPGSDSQISSPKKMPNKLFSWSIGLTVEASSAAHFSL